MFVAEPLHDAASFALTQGQQLHVICAQGLPTRERDARHLVLIGACQKLLACGIGLLLYQRLALVVGLPCSCGAVLVGVAFVVIQAFVLPDQITPCSLGFPCERLSTISARATLRSRCRLWW